MCSLGAFNYVIKAMSILKPILFSGQCDLWMAFSGKEIGLHICLCCLFPVPYHTFFSLQNGSL